MSHQSDKSEEASFVLKLMDDDYDYNHALAIAINKFNVDVIALESELDIYI